MAKLTENQLKWKVHLDAASSSGQTLADYARSQDLDLKKLYSYSRAIQQRQKPTAKTKFVRVQPVAVSTPNVRIDFSNGVRVSIAAPPDLGTLLTQLAKLP